MRVTAMLWWIVLVAVRKRKEKRWFIAKFSAKQIPIAATTTAWPRSLRAAARAHVARWISEQSHLKSCGLKRHRLASAVTFSGFARVFRNSSCFFALSPTPTARKIEESTDFTVN